MRITSALFSSSVLVLAACSGGGGSTAAVGVQHGDSTGTPLAGSTVGNWELETVAVVQDTGVPHPMRVGMNLRLSKAGVEVLLDEYIGPGSILPKVLDGFYGKYEVTEINDPEKGFDITLTLDFSNLIHAKLRSFYHTIQAKGTLVGDKMQVAYLLQEFLNVGGTVTEVGRDELNLSFRKGSKVAMSAGNWDVDKVLVLVDTDPKAPLLFPAPIPNRIVVGDKLEIGASEITSLFGGVVSKAGFPIAQPDFIIKFHDALVGNATAQGFLAIEGKKAGKFDNQGAVLEFNFFHTGSALVGDMKGAWAADLGASPTRFYQVYMTLSPAKPIPLSLSGAGDPAVATLTAANAATDTFGIMDAETMRTRIESYRGDLSSIR